MMSYIWLFDRRLRVFLKFGPLHVPLTWGPEKCKIIDKMYADGVDVCRTLAHLPHLPCVNVPGMGEGAPGRRCHVYPDYVSLRVFIRDQLNKSVFY